MFTTAQEVSTESPELRVLNTSRSVLAYPALLAGYRTVPEALEDNFISTYVRIFLTATARSLATDSLSENPEEISDQLLNHLAASEGGRPLSELCRDGASPVSSSVVPLMLDWLEQGKEVSSLTFLLAAYGHYLQAGIDDKGQSYTVDEPQLTGHDWAILSNGDALSLLDISVLAPAHLRTFPEVVAHYKSYRNQLACYGLVFTLKQTLCAFWEEEHQARK